MSRHLPKALARDASLGIPGDEVVKVKAQHFSIFEFSVRREIVQFPGAQ